MIRNAFTLILILFSSIAFANKEEDMAEYKRLEAHLLKRGGEICAPIVPEIIKKYKDVPNANKDFMEGMKDNCEVLFLFASEKCLTPYLQNMLTLKSSDSTFKKQSAELGAEMKKCQSNNEAQLRPTLEKACTDKETAAALLKTVAMRLNFMRKN